MLDRAEKYPIKEKLATDRETVLAWVAREMGYSRDKPRDLAKNPLGYEEKRTRLSRRPEEPQSVFDFMGNTYWHRVGREDKNFMESPNEHMAQRCLQAYAKVVAGLGDKVAFALWLSDEGSENPRSADALLDDALDMIRVRSLHLEEEATYGDHDLLALTPQPFENNPMGKAILGLHKSYEQNPHDAESLRLIAIEGAAAGVLMLEAYARDMQAKGFEPILPKPGVGSGNIEAWVD